MWHRRLAHLNHQDLKRLLESSGERITDPIKPIVKPISDSLNVQPFADSAVEPVADPDIKPIVDPMDVELVTDPMDVEPVTDLMDVEQIADPDCRAGNGFHRCRANHRSGCRAGEGSHGHKSSLGNTWIVSDMHPGKATTTYCTHQSTSVLNTV